MAAASLAFPSGFHNGIVQRGLWRGFGGAGAGETILLREVDSVIGSLRRDLICLAISKGSLASGTSLNGGCRVGCLLSNARPRDRPVARRLKFWAVEAKLLAASL